VPSAEFRAPASVKKRTSPGTPHTKSGTILTNQREFVPAPSTGVTEYVRVLDINHHDSQRTTPAAVDAPTEPAPTVTGFAIDALADSFHIAGIEHVKIDNSTFRPNYENGSAYFCTPCEDGRPCKYHPPGTYVSIITPRSSVDNLSLSSTSAEPPTTPQSPVPYDRQKTFDSCEPSSDFPLIDCAETSQQQQPSPSAVSPSSSSAPPPPYTPTFPELECNNLFFLTIPEHGVAALSHDLLLLQAVRARLEEHLHDNFVWSINEGACIQNHIDNYLIDTTEDDFSSYSRHVCDTWCFGPYLRI
jgi:hypothetical protein